MHSMHGRVFKTGVALRAFIKSHWVLLIVLAVGLVVRVYRFGEIPPGLNQDEASTGYDAYSVFAYGVDRIGFRFPVMYVSWGSGMYALPGYLMAPFIAIFGLTVSAIRSVNFVFGLASIVVLYDLVRRIHGRETASLVAFFIAISPWHVMVSRWALDSNLLPAIFLFGVWFVARARDGSGYLHAAAAVFALCLYAYGTAYVAVPAYLAGIVAYLLLRKQASYTLIVQCAAIFLVLALPVALFVVINHWDLSSITLPFFSIPHLDSVPRFETVSIVFQEHALQRMGENLRTLWNLLLTQDDGLIWNAIPRYGTIYLMSMPFVLIGFIASIVRMVRRRALSPEFLMVWWVVAAVILASLQPVNINRINVLFIPLLYFLALGVHEISRPRPVLWTIVAMYCVSFVGFSHAYFVRYPLDAQGPFFATFGEAVDAASDMTDGPVCVTANINQPYIFVLFYRKIDPRVFARTVVYDNPGGEFQNVRSFDRYTFGIDRCDVSTGAYVLDEGERSAFENGEYSLTTVGRYTVAMPLR